MSLEARENLWRVFLVSLMTLGIAYVVVGGNDCDARRKSDWQRRCRDNGGTVAETLTERGAAGWVCVPPPRNRP